MSRPNDTLGLPAGPERPRLGPLDVHLWYAQPERLTEPALLSQYARLLCPEEQTRHLRYRIERVRHEFLVTRALVRTVLSRYTGVDPAQWRFTTNAYGKPDAASPPLAEPLRFNLSHTRGMIVCAVTRLEEIGVDVENLDRQATGPNLARRYFSALEVTDLLKLPPERQQEVFFDYWTLKEAYIKARGKGLAIPLDQFSFDLSSRDSVGISFSPQLRDDPSTWRFAQFSPTSEHRVALAVRLRTNDELVISAYETLPLAEPRGGSAGG
jgi:4'-phosphopantetheinyl transferase